MFTVIITEKGGEQRRMDFDKPEVTIGRVQGNDIILPKGNVSKRHSRIVLKDGKFIIVDLKSTNGTYVNGRKITSPLVLKDTDKIYIGDFIITVEDSASEKEKHVTGATPIPPPAIPSGVYEPGPSGTPSLVSAPPPVPKRPPGGVAAPPPMPAGRRTAPPVEDDLDLADDLPPPAPPAPAPRATTPMAAQAPPRGDRDSQPVVRTPAPPVRPEPSRASQPAPTVGRTTSRDEVPAGMHSPQAPAPAVTKPMAAVAAPAMPQPAPVQPARPTQPPHSHGAEPPRPRATMRSFDAVQPPPTTETPAVAGAGRALDVLREIHDRVAAQLDLARLPVERLADEALWQRTETAVVDLLEQLEADGALPVGLDQDALVKDALNELLGLGALDDLLADDEVGDILVNRSDRVLVERGGRVAPASKLFSSETALRNAIDRLLASSGRRLDEGSPLIDVRLPDGTRVIAAQSPVAARGLTLTVRKPKKTAPTMEELVRGGSLSQQMASFLGTCVAARRNIVVCGGASAGKTSLLGALAGLVPANERVVSVEEVSELALPHEQWIALEARSGAASLVDVLRAALRMRTDRLVVGEVRGVEALEVLTAFAAGEGGLASVAGDGAAAALARLESLARLSAPEASARGLRELAAHAAHIVVHMARYSDGVRRVAAISEVSGVQGEGYAVRELFQYQMQGHGPDGVRGRFAGAGVVPRFYGELEARGEKADPAVFR